MSNEIYNERMKNIVLAIILSFVFVVPSYAQEQEERIFPNSADVAPELASPQHRSDVTDVPESTIIKDKYAGEYQQSTIQNLSKLYWAKGVLDIKNDKAIDNFIRINECDFYKANVYDDFKWQKIRKAARKMLRERVPTYSEKFQIVVPIDLGRYDPVRKGFPLVNDSEFKDLRRIEVGGNEGDVCGWKWDIEYYPRNAILILNKPFNYTFMELDEHLAQAYIIRNNEEKPDRPREIRTKKFNRLAFARVRLRFMEYQGTERERNRTKVAVIFGAIDGVDVFENADETGLLSSVDFK